jgi:dihydroorotate dehydrogenase
MPRLLHLLDPEIAHRIAIRAIPWLPRRTVPASPRLSTRLGPLDLAHPLGLAAGFDKSAEAFAGALRQGFAWVEVGTVTPRPQPGNPRPRLFRLVEDRAVINRMGFNNDGLETVAARLARRDPAAGLVGANIGINKDSTDPVGDYVQGLRRLHPLVDWLTVNVSSPNTPGLRALQRREPLTRLLGALLEARASLGAPKPLLLKIAPDLTPEEEDDIAAVALGMGIDGLIVSNTTVARPPGLRSRHRDEPGGLSGRPLFGPSTELLRRMARRLGGRIPLVGLGGIASGEHAYAKIRAGACALQLYTAFAYEGPGLIARILRELDAQLARDGFARLENAIAVDAA